MKKDLIAVSDLTREDIFALFESAAELKRNRSRRETHHPLKGRSLGMIFGKQSTRTRISFEVAMFELGGHALFLSAEQMQLNRGETLADSAKVLSRYLDAILIRTHDHQEVVELAKHASIPVINGLTDHNHPVQILSDLFTLQEKRGHLDNLKVAYIGDGNNVAHSWMIAAATLGFHVAVASPPGCQPRRPEELGISGCIDVLEDPLAAADNADVLYTDVWVSMGHEGEAQAKNEKLKPYQIDRKLVDAAAEDVWVMHCLPAHRGMEISAEVMDGPRSIVFDQAENRLHVQKAILQALLSPSKQ